ncbi:MAG: dihydrodipicolinate synthase family protein [SAR324 cluster bacterium]|nr:dihydrodipicolinate synthase family protein [SAR324 cluster bacterium]
MSRGPFNGVLVPVLTPFKSDFEPDAERFVSLCKWALEQGAAGLAIFGTTSEANSMSFEQRENLLEKVLESGVPAEKLMPGTGGCAVKDVVRMTSKAVAAGCGGTLMLPPFYYKTINDDGIFRFVSEVIQAVGDDRLNLYLYHIPPQAVVGYSVELLSKLYKAYPSVVVGVKDSSGDWDNTYRFIREIPEIDVFPGSEGFLLQGMRAGARGCITASGNVNVAGIHHLYENWQSDEADALQARISEIRSVLQAYPMIPALKVVTGDYLNDPEWRRVLPPLNPLSEKVSNKLLADLGQIGFRMGEH